MFKSKETAKEYNRKYWLENKERLCKFNQEYRNANKEKIAAQKQQYRNINKVEIAQHRHEYYLEHREEHCLKMKQYYLDNLEEKKEYTQKYYQKNKAKLSSKNKEWRLEHSDHCKLLHQSYYNSHKQQIIDHYYKRLDEEIDFKILANLRIRLNDAIRNGSKSKSTRQLLGCEIKYFLDYLESQFDDEMSWSNYGIYGWHIDHIKPCAAFNLLNPNEQQECFHYTNLQPLWAEMNWSKGAKFSEENSTVKSLEEEEQ